MLNKLTNNAYYRKKDLAAEKRKALYLKLV